jgi:SET domain-containing protein
MRKLPHEGVYTRLKASPIHGVGVFAIRHIPEGALVFPDDDEPMVWVDKKSIERIPKALQKLYKDFSIVRGSKYASPRHFDALTTSWYLNSSTHPNVAADRRYRFHAIRDISPGEELTVDYRTYSGKPRLLLAARKRRRKKSP